MTQYCLDCYRFVTAHGALPDNYCLECSSHNIPEYVPEEVVAKYGWDEVCRLQAPPQLPSVADISMVLNAVVTNLKREQALPKNYDKQKFTDFIKRYDGDLMNVSAIFMLRRARISTTEENKKMAYGVIREAQLCALRITPDELVKFGRENMSATIIKAAKAFEQDLFNLSPMWTLKLARIRTQKVGDLMRAMYSLDLILRTKKQL